MTARTLFVVTLLGLGLCWTSTGCGGGQAAPPPPPMPTISSITPTNATAGGAAFTLTINRMNFVAASMVNFNGTAPATTFVSATQLTVAIPAAAIASAGTVAVTVTSPAPGGGCGPQKRLSFAKTPACCGISRLYKGL